MKKKNEMLRRAFIEADIEYFEKASQQEHVEWMPSERFEKKMKKLIRRKDRTCIQWQTGLKHAVCVALVLAIFGGVAYNVEAVRSPLFDFFSKIYEKFSSVFVDNENEANAPRYIETEYFPTNIPNGYRVEQRNEIPTCNQIFYINDSGMTIQFTQQTLSQMHLMLDTEGVELHEIMVGSQIGQYFVNKETLFLSWTAHDYTFWLSVPDSFTIEEAVRIAESLSCE